MRKIIVALSLFLVISCQSTIQENEQAIFHWNDFGSAVHLKGTIIPLDRLVDASRIRVIPKYNLLLIADNKDDFLAKAYTLDKFSYIKSFIGKGEGNNEQLSALTIQYTAGQQVIYVSDAYKKRIFSYAIDSLISPKSSTLPVSSINMRNVEISKPVIINQNKVVDFRYNFKENEIGVLNFYNINGEFLSFKGAYPTIDKPIEKYQMSDVFFGGLNLSEDGSRLILNYYNTDYIDLYDTLSHLLKRVHGPDVFYPDFSTETFEGGGMMTGPTKKSMLAYTGGSARMNNDIFVLYDGGMASREGYHLTKLLRFNHNLVPIQAYQLDTPIFAFDIDWEAGIIYGLTNEKEGSIITFKL